jgi:hypothetical protein
MPKLTTTKKLDIEDMERISVDNATIRIWDAENVGRGSIKFRVSVFKDKMADGGNLGISGYEDYDEAFQNRMRRKMVKKPNVAVGRSDSWTNKPPYTPIKPSDLPLDKYLEAKRMNIDIDERFAGGGDIRDYDNYDDDENENEGEEQNLIDLSEEFNIPVDVLKEYADEIGVDYDRLSSRDINYYGNYSSEEDFMESLVDEGVISGSALSGYLYMTSTDCRITAGEEADAYVDNLDNSVLIDEADLENKLDELNELVEKIEELENEIQEKTDEIEGLEDKLTQTEDEDDSESIKSDIEDLREELKDLENELVNSRKDFDNLDYQDEDEIVDAAREIVRDKQYEYVYDILDKDPVEYFVNELGSYTEEELAKSSFINIDYEKLARDFTSDYNIIEGQDGDIYVFTSYAKGGATASASVLRTAKKFVNEVNRLIALAYDEDGDPIPVYDTSSTWQSPSIYFPLKLSRGTLYGIYVDYPFGLASKPRKMRIIVRKSDMEYEGIGTLRDIAKMYRKALKDAGIQYKTESNTKFDEGGMTLEEQNKSMLLGKTKEYEHHSKELREIIAKNPNIPAWVIAKATRASTDISDITHYLDSLPANLKKGGKLWIQGAIKREGSLRKKAKEMGLIKGEEKLSMSDLNRLESLGGVWSKRANLARTLRRFAQEKSKNKLGKGDELDYAKGGGTKRKDLFETPEKMPKKLNAIFERYWEEKGDSMDYQDMANMHKEVEAIGYTFDSYLDNVPYGLRPIGVELNELEGYDEMAKGGNLSYKKGTFLVEFTWDKESEYDFDSRKVYVKADSVSEAEEIVFKKFGVVYKNLQIIEIERVMSDGGETDNDIQGYVDLSMAKPQYVNDSVMFELPVIDIVKKDMVQTSEEQIQSAMGIVELMRKTYGNALNTYEKVYAIMLNKANKPIYIYEHSKGGIDGTIIDPQLVLAAANKTLAKGIILVHNHPSGQLKASPADINVTKKVGEACKYFDIVLLDHIIITADGFYSFAEKKII